ncbi:MAG TPA: GlxA family transcriptional regulator [Candidatus Angelobacter sp.]|jgi:transcriptional regulator GlxA family with amidase domain|nr:GlxA family transcriptional regulator [Candidatus Angelobacter sp.]
MPKPKTIAIVAVPNVQMLDVSGPLDVFAEANVQARKEVYKLLVVATVPGEIRSCSGVRLVPDCVIGRGPIERIDTLLIAGAPDAPETTPRESVVLWLKQVVPAARRYGSVCTGAFMLAKAGFLEGRRVTTHWAVAKELARMFPKTIVEADSIHVRDGRLRTAAGVTAGLDLALALVEEDLGRDLALKVAGQLVMFFRRPGGQNQFVREGAAGPEGRSALQEMQRWIAANPGENHSIGSLAKRVELSPRHFARIFKSEVGLTPAQWVTEARVTAARRLLEFENSAPKEVAAKCGFTDADTLRRAFVRLVGATPAEYKKRHSHFG